jgi:SAM-dependent methyltransferase
MIHRLAIITGVSEELNDGQSGNDYSIGPILESGMFEKVVLAVPDTPASKPLADLAERLGICFLAGDPHNVCHRIRQVLDIYPAEIISRFQLRASWVDMVLVAESLQLVEAGQDYADYDYDVNYAMGCDTFSRQAFERVESILKTLPDNDARRITYQFSPWALMQDRSRFAIGTVNVQHTYPLEKALALRSRLDRLIGHKQNMIGSPVDHPALRYVKTAEFLQDSWFVGEISAGFGGGAAYLSRFCNGVKAYEINPDYVAYAQKNYAAYPVNYVLGDDRCLAESAASFDCVVSLHTLEHVADDYCFLRHIGKALKPDGQLVIEVPRLMPKPMGMPLWPFHEREYEVEQMRSMLAACGFSIEREFGISRNEYVEIDKSREAMMFIARVIK